MSAAQQLFFQLAHRPALGREDFLVAPCNAQAVALIDSWPHWAQPILVLAGPKGAGKTHLAQVWRSRSGASVLDAGEFGPSNATALVGPKGLVIERADLLVGAGDRSRADRQEVLATREQALFHLINWARERGRPLLLTACSRPADWGIALPDLATRLTGAPLATLSPPDDTLMAGLIAKLMTDRQLTVSPSVVDYLIARIERSHAAAMTVVAALDRLSLTHKRPISVRLASEVLAQLATGGRGNEGIDPGDGDFKTADT